MNILEIPELVYIYLLPEKYLLPEGNKYMFVEFLIKSVPTLMFGSLLLLVFQ